MTLLRDKIDLSNFSIENMDVSDLESIIDAMPTEIVMDLNVAEKGLILTLQGQNLCQEKIFQVDRWIAFKEADKGRAWKIATLEKAKEEGYKTGNDKSWYAEADEDYIKAKNELLLAKATKKYLEGKASLFSGWHYAFKTFLKRDYSLEKIANVHESGYNDSEALNHKPKQKNASDDWV